MVDKGATITFNDDIVAFVPQRHLEKEDWTKLGKGEEAEFKVIEFSKDFKRVVVSHTAIFREQERTNMKKAAKKVAASNSDKTTLGDLDALADLKKKMKDNE